MFTTVRQFLSSYPISFLGLALAIALLLKAVFTFEDMPLWMFPSGAGSEPSVNQGEDPATHRNVAGPSHPNPPPGALCYPWGEFI